jgi:hypothetical protein
MECLNIQRTVTILAPPDVSFSAAELRLAHEHSILVPTHLPAPGDFVVLQPTLDELYDSLLADFQESFSLFRGRLALRDPAAAARMSPSCPLRRKTFRPRIVSVLRIHRRQPARGKKHRRFPGEPPLLAKPPFSCAAP